MDKIEKVAVLRKFALFGKLNDSELGFIADFATYQTIPAGETFIEQEDESQSTYLIFKGSCKVYRITEDGEEINIAVLGPGKNPPPLICSPQNRIFCGQHLNFV